MGNGTGGCKPAADVLGVSSVNCNRCPFPFCVVVEARIIKTELSEHLARIRRRLGSSVEETAKALGVSLRSAYRYTSVHEDTGCTQCNLTHSQDVMCKSNIYSVVYADGRYTIVLNKHQHATQQELKTVECFVDYVFPSSVMKKSTGDHDYWVLSRVEPEEEEGFRSMCDALSKFTLSLNKGAECL